MNFIACLLLLSTLADAAQARTPERSSQNESTKIEDGPLHPIGGMRIINGHNAFRGQFPHQVSIQLRQSYLTRYEHNCGGSIISQDWIVTAAHCVVGKSLSLMRVVAGTVSLVSGGTIHRVTERVVHKDFKTYFPYANDYAVLRVTPPFTFNSYVKRITPGCAFTFFGITFGDGIATGLTCYASGWGRTDPNSNTLPTILQYAELQALTDSQCEALIPGYVDKAHVCTLTPPKTICNDGWMFNQFNGKCLYFRNGDRKTWVEAAHKCRSMHATLASFQSKHDLEILSSIATIGNSSIKAATRMLAWTGGHSIFGKGWAWDSGEPWGGIVLHIHDYENPPKEDKCLAASFDDNDGAVTVNPLVSVDIGQKEPTKLDCWTTQIHYICQKNQILVEGINTFTHFPQPTLPLPEVNEAVSSPPKGSYGYAYPQLTWRNPFEPFVRRGTEIDLLGSQHSPTISMLEMLNKWRTKRSIPTPYTNHRIQVAPHATNQYQSSYYSPEHAPSYSTQERYLNYESQSQASPENQSIKIHASKILQQELAFKWRPCPNGWKYFWTVDKCYYSSENDLRTWEGARYRCHSLGGKLASFHNRLELTTIQQIGTVGNLVLQRSYSAWTGGHYVDGKGWRWDDEDEFWGDMDEHIHQEYYENPPTKDLCMAVFNDDARGAGLVDPYTRIPYDCKSYRMPFVCSMSPIRPPANQKPPVVQGTYKPLEERDVHTIRNYVKEKLGTVAKMSYDPETKGTSYENSKECWVGLASINKQPWKWEDGSPLDTLEHLPVDLNPSGEENNTCVVVHPDNFYGAGFGHYSMRNRPAGSFSERLDCHRKLLPFLCQKDPSQNDQPNGDSYASYYSAVPLTPSYNSAMQYNLPSNYDYNPSYNQRIHSPYAPNQHTREPQKQYYAGYQG
ncbi:unnamed protein product [Cyprideis torosa]|uniref:Uncharacterized protein n=1 Tax=Cyprideis torosa TaxID=163714 RepID=A0A7R8W9D8_9CRUS|nr:unnamed protein product [Cyprideis torosa]CAG0885241.1 unnamed protein product [Cyprideis torosa]